MRDIQSRLVFFFIAAALTVTICAAISPDSAAFNRLRAGASGVPGWIEQKDKYQAFTVQELYGLIDGGATEYEKQGLKSGITITLTNGNKVLEIYCDDFGKASRAKGMVEIKKKSLSDPKVIPKATLSPAIYDGVLGGCIACFAKGDFYIEMSLTGYNSLDKAVEDAAIFINTLSRVIGK
jgi:hypothetical protein